MNINELRKILKIEDKSNISLDHLTGDASSREYFRLRENNFSLIICIDPNMRNIERFCKIQKMLLENGVQVPEILDINLKIGLLRIEDLGQDQLIGSTLKDDINPYFHAINELKKLQDISAKSESLPCDHEKIMNFDFLLDEVESANDFFIKKFLNRKANTDKINEFFKSHREAIDKQKITLCHRDFHSKNIMIHKDKTVIIDFQDCRLGPKHYDIVSLLEDSYVNLYEKKKIIKKYYINQLNIVDDGDFDYQYTVTALMRIYKAVGTFSKILIEKKNIKYLVFIGNAIEKLKQLSFKIDRGYILREHIVRPLYEY